MLQCIVCTDDKQQQVGLKLCVKQRSQHSTHGIDRRMIMAKNALALYRQIIDSSNLDKIHLLEEKLQSAMFLFRAAL